jgi:hypothetical protein
MMPCRLFRLPRPLPCDTAGRDRLEDLVTFMNVSLSAPVARSADTATGNLGVAGARFILDGGLGSGNVNQGLFLKQHSRRVAFASLL